MVKDRDDIFSPSDSSDPDMDFVIEFEDEDDFGTSAKITFADEAGAAEKSSAIEEAEKIMGVDHSESVHTPESPDFSDLDELIEQEPQIGTPGADTDTEEVIAAEEYEEASAIQSFIEDEELMRLSLPVTDSEEEDTLELIPVENSENPVYQYQNPSMGTKVSSFWQEHMGNLGITFLASALILVAVVLGTFIFLHFRSNVVVPDVTGRTYQEAWQILSEKGLSPVKSAEKYSDTYPADYVMEVSQMGERVKKQTVIYLTISRGPEPVIVPETVDGEIQEFALADYITMQLEDAVKAAEDAGILVEIEYGNNPYVPASVVYGQNPDPGTMVKPGDKVILRVNPEKEEPADASSEEEDSSSEEDPKYDYNGGSSNGSGNSYGGNSNSGNSYQGGDNNYYPAPAPTPAPDPGYTPEPQPPVINGNEGGGQTGGGSEGGGSEGGGETGGGSEGGGETGGGSEGGGETGGGSEGGGETGGGSEGGGETGGGSSEPISTSTPSGETYALAPAESAAE